MQLFLPESIGNILSVLQNAGFEAYAVGGCVRDLLRGAVPNDYDIATSAAPVDVQRLFAKTVPTGAVHGTVTVIADGEPVEVTTYRTESGYSDCRRPDSVAFVADLRTDLSRRDFTVNAMAYNDTDGLVDCFGGQKDLADGVLCAVGNPHERFREDALRILRLFRFAAVLGFSCEPETRAAALECAPLLPAVSRERIAEELQKAVCGKNVPALEMPVNAGMLAFIGITACRPLAAVPALPSDPALRFYTFLSLCTCDPAAVLETLKCSNRLKNFAAHLSALRRGPLPSDAPAVKRALREAGAVCFYGYLEYLKAAEGTDTAVPRALADEILENREPYLLCHLAVNGRDLHAVGIRGEATGRILARLLDDVTENPDLNKPEILLPRAIEYGTK